MSGTYDCADLQRLQVVIDKMWANNQTNVDYVSYAEALNAVRNEQTADVRMLQDPEKDRTVRVYWAKDCDTEVDDCSDDCTIGGDEPDADCKDYALDICKQVSFSVPEKRFRTSELTKDEVLAKAMLRKLKNLDEYLAQAAVANLDTFAGTNLFAGIGSVSGGLTYVDPSLWTGDIMGYFAQVALMNKLAGTYLLNGSNLYQQNWLAQYNKMTENDTGAAAKLATLKAYWDPFNVDAVNGGKKVTYLISKGSVAFANKAYYPLNAPVEYKGPQYHIRYSIESKNLPGVVYDVMYNTTCVSNEIKHNFNIMVKAGFFLNPLGCDESRTGILKFQCGNPPASSS
jgi:hypothetical protein